MSVVFDPIISNFFYTLSLIPHLTRPKDISQRSIIETEHFPFISVLMTFYHENREDIDMTISSLINQTYPRDKFEILMMVEPDDTEVQSYVEDCVKRLREYGIAGRIIVSDGKLRIKPHALNLGIEQAKGEYCAFYDASDDIEKDQLEKAILLMKEKDYDVVQAKVLRRGSSLLSRFLLIDTVFWFQKYIPLILKFAKGFPLSGEGLFIRRSVLKESGNFPEVLTEDAYLGLILSEKNKRFALVESVVTEKAPKNIKAHIIQKLRWHRGYLTCLKKLFHSKMSLKRKFFFLLPFSSPITCALAFIGWLIIISHYFSLILFPSLEINISWMQSPLYTKGIYYWSVALAYVGIPLIFLSYTSILLESSMKKYIPLIILIPFYWMFVGFCSTTSIFRGTKRWGKTER